MAQGVRGGGLKKCHFASDVLLNDPLADANKRDKIFLPLAGYNGVNGSPFLFPMLPLAIAPAGISHDCGYLAFFGPLKFTGSGNKIKPIAPKACASRA